MIKKRITFLCASLAFLALTVLVWQVSAPLRYFQEVRSLEWEAEAVSKPYDWIHLSRYSEVWDKDLYITQPQHQQQILAALEGMTYEGVYRKDFGMMPADDAWQIQLYWTEAGHVSFCLLKAPAEYYDDRPRASLRFDNGYSIVLGGTEALLQAVEAALEAAGKTE